MVERTRTSIRSAFAVVFLFLSTIAFPASIVVPTLEMITHGSMVGSQFTMQTYGNFDIVIQGGYKFGGSISVGLLNNTNLENLPPGPTTLGGINFLGAEMTIRDVFSAPVSVTYFVGQTDIFCSGVGFAEFSVPAIMTRYRGFLYFPSTDPLTAPIYDGIYQEQGTGAKVEITPKENFISFDVYLYEDTHPAFGALGSYSSDLRFLLNTDNVRLESFLGGTYSPSSPYGIYRGGILFYAANPSVEFLGQIGIPEWDPNLDPSFSVDLFYLMVEERVHFGLFSIVPTVFWHPAYYNQQSYPTELGTFDVNLNFYLADASKSSFQGGLEGNFRFQSSAGTFTVTASPWVGFATPGVLWNVKINANLWPFSLSTLLDAFVGVRAEL